MRKQKQWMTFTRKGKGNGKDNLAKLNRRNVRLALVYQKATPWRRQEILAEYYRRNEYWITRWPRWEPRHWQELTQIYVTFWHEAFMRYKRKSNKSVFNFYMENCWRSRATQEYKTWLEKSRRLFNPEDGIPGNPRKELFVNPQSEYDKAVLRARLNRCLDSKDMEVFKEYVYGSRELNDLMREELQEKGMEVTPSAIYARTNHFKRYRMRDVVDRLALFTSEEELVDIISRDEDYRYDLLKQSEPSRLVHPSHRKAVA